MAIFSDVQNAFSVKLAALSGVPLVEWENTSSTAIVKDTPYLRPTLLWARSVLMDTKSKQMHSGFLQIDSYVPLNKGMKAVNDIFDAIYAHFKDVNSLASGSSTVFIRAVSRGPSMRDDAWYKGIIEIYFTCYD